jgi:hypothetical protein
MDYIGKFDGYIIDVTRIFVIGSLDGYCGVPEPPFRLPVIHVSGKIEP